MQKKMKTISLIVPAYNEEKRLGNTLSLWQKFLAKENSEFKIAEIIIIDDGSEDKTCQVAESFKSSLPIKIIKISPNKGKGGAVRTGIKEATSDFLYIYDADAAVLPEELNKLFCQTAECDIVVGSRMADGAKTNMSFGRRFVGLCFHIFCLPLLPKIKDASCGAKLLKNNVAKKIFELQKLDRFAFDIEILWLAEKLNYKIKEVGVMWTAIPGSKVKILRDAPEMFFSVLKIHFKNFKLKDDKKNFKRN
jgi:dolichyl-phosphate beta-glucosyltransferase